MSTPVTMPELGESVSEGTVTRWLKAVGDKIAVDEPLLEVSTDKVDTEVPSPVAGILVDLAVAEDETVAVGAVLATVAPVDAGTDDAAGATAPAQDRAAASAAAPDPAPVATPETAAKPTAPEADPAPPADPPPVAERSAVAEPQPPAPPVLPTQPAKPAPNEGADRSRAGTTEPMSRVRQVISRRMLESLATSPQLTTVQEVDVTRIARLRKAVRSEFERREGVKLTFLPFFCKAAVETLQAFPAVNASISADGKEVTYHRAVHLGIAVDSPRGLVVPVIRDAQDLSLAGIARAIDDLATRTRANKLGVDEQSGGTFTVTNIGSVGTLFDTPIINQPQVAILATGAIVRRPTVVVDDSGDEQIAIRSRCFLPLTYDHRLVDGADAGRFVSALKARLEEGAFGSDLGI